MHISDAHLIMHWCHLTWKWTWGHNGHISKDDVSTCNSFEKDKGQVRNNQKNKNYNTVIHYSIHIHGTFALGILCTFRSPGLDKKIINPDKKKNQHYNRSQHLQNEKKN